MALIQAGQLPGRQAEQNSGPHLPVIVRAQRNCHVLADTAHEMGTAEGRRVCGGDE